MVSSTLVILSALALFSSAQATPFSWLKKDFVRDVVSAGRRLEGHTSGEGPEMDMAGCEKECPGFLKMLMEVGPKLSVDEKDPDFANKMEKAIKENVCPRKQEAECPLAKCDEGTKQLMGGLACVCECDGLMGLDAIKTDDQIKANCDVLNKAMSCIKSKSGCSVMAKMMDADPEAKKDQEKFDKLCGSSSSSFASKRCVVGASLAAVFTAAVKEL